MVHVVCVEYVEYMVSIWCVYGVVRVECVGEGQQRRFRGEHFLVFTSGYSNGSISWHKVPFSSSSPWVQLPTGWENSAIRTKELGSEIFEIRIKRRAPIHTSSLNCFDQYCDGTVPRGLNGRNCGRGATGEGIKNWGWERRLN